MTRIFLHCLAVLALSAPVFGQLSNRPPQAAAGADQFVSTGSTVTLNGSGSADPEGQAITYAWRLISVPERSLVQLFNSDTALASFTPDQPGDYFVELVVSDGTETGSDAIRVRVSGVAVVQRPVAIITGPATARRGETVVLLGSGSTSPTGVGLTYAWRRTFGLPVELAGTDTPGTSFRSLSPGFVTVELTVADSSAISLPATATVVIIDAPPALPVVDAGADVIANTGRVVTLQGLLLARRPQDVTLRWTYESGPVAELAMKNRATTRPTFTPPVSGVYTFKLVSDDGQNKAEDRVEVRVFGASTLPVSGGSSGGCSAGDAPATGLLPWLLSLLAWRRLARSR